MLRMASVELPSPISMVTVSSRQPEPTYGPALSSVYGFGHSQPVPWTDSRQPEPTYGLVPSSVYGFGQSQAVHWKDLQHPVAPHLQTNPVRVTPSSQGHHDSSHCCRDCLKSPFICASCISGGCQICSGVLSGFCQS